MRKKLIAALIAVVFCIAAAVGMIIYLENQPDDGTGTEASTAELDPAATTEETLALTFSTENPDEVAPEDTFGEENEVPPVTQDPEVPATTEDPDSNALPEDEF